MAIWRDDPDRAADNLITTSLDGLALPQSDARVLAVDAGPALLTSLQGQHPQLHIQRIDRRATAATPEPTMAPASDDPLGFTHAFVRLPKSKDELEFNVHRLLAWMTPTGRVYIYGGNDEGIRSAPKRLASLGVAIETVAAHSHGRVLSLQCPTDLTQLKTRDDQWRMVQSLDVPGEPDVESRPSRPWVSYPGLFANGQVDLGTALLLQHLPTHHAGAAVLDYGCGTGIIARTLIDRDPSAVVTALDVDTFALAATRENAPAARTLLSHRLKGSGRHDLIVSNPPIHNGFREDVTALHHMIEDAPKHLLPKGRLVFVVQRRVPVEAQLKAQFATVDIAADAGTFRIWSASQPIKHPAADLKATAAKPAGKKLPGPQKYGDIEISDEVETW